MKTKQITLCGQQVTIGYCFATEIAFRKYTGVSVEDMDAKNPEHIIYLILSAMIAYYEAEKLELPIKDTDLMYKSNPTEMIQAVASVFELNREWYAVPKGDTTDKPADEEPKND
jgi:hypothetical protein